MLTQNNLWKFQVLVERMWRLSLDIAAEGVKLKTYDEGILIVAEETRKLTDQLYKHYEHILTTNDLHEDMSALQRTIQQVRIFSVNGVLEMLKMHMVTQGTTAQLPILFEALNNVSNDLIELVSASAATPCVQVEVKNRNTTTDQSVFLMALQIGAQLFVENIQYVHEVFSYNKTTDQELFSDDHHMVIRGEQIPVIDCYDAFNLKNDTQLPNQMGIAVVIYTQWDREPRKYAVLVDDILRWGIFKTPLGKDAPCAQSKFSNHTRACWDTVDGQQFVFLDWERLCR